MWPDDCLQATLGQKDWWIHQEDSTLCRGMLVKAFVPHFDQVPYMFEPVGRTEPTRHDSATVKVSPLRVGQSLRRSELPVAAMPLHPGEVWAAYRAKGRPCLVIAESRPAVDRALTRGIPNHSIAPTILVAPYYGVDQDGRRAGYQPSFIERVRHCEYPQFLWDKLPIDGKPNESLLRLDQIQPIGAHYQAYRATGFKLSDNAMSIIDELLGWLMRGGVEEDSVITLYRAEIEEEFRK